MVYGGSRTHCLSWFRTAGQDPPPDGVNVLDWMVDIAALDTRTPDKEEFSRARVERLVDAWRRRSPTWDLDVKEELPTDIEKLDPTPDSASAKRMNQDRDPSATKEHLQLAPAVTHAVSDIMSIHTLESRDEMRPGWVRQTAILTRRWRENIVRCHPHGTAYLMGLFWHHLELGTTFCVIWAKHLVRMTFFVNFPGHSLFASSSQFWRSRLLGSASFWASPSTSYPRYIHRSLLCEGIIRR